MLNCEIVSDAVPEFVAVNVCDLVCPSTTLPKLKLAGLTVNPACTPVPLTGIASGDPGALVVTVTVPAAAPTAVGAKVTDKTAALEGLNVVGTVTPLAEKPAPETVTPVICKDPVPEFVSVICFTELVLVPTLPKLKLVGLATRLPVAAVVPVPLSATVIAGFVGSLLVMERLPVAAPAVVGLNVSDNGADWPAAMTFGVVIPLTPKPAPVVDMAETVRSDAPVFDIVKLEVPFEPTVTLPKLTVVLLREICWLEATPFADRFTTTGAVPVAPCTERVPFTAPFAVGVTLTERFPDCPGGSEIGKVIPLTLNWELETVACVRVTAAAPAFLTASVWVLDLPTLTFPKLTVAGFI
jgi:hypothetical protein